MCKGYPTRVVRISVARWVLEHTAQMIGCFDSIQLTRNIYTGKTTKQGNIHVLSLKYTWRCS